MSEATTDETPERDGAHVGSRVNVQPGELEDEHAEASRVLLIADEGTDEDALGEKLANAGFEVTRASAKEAMRRVEELAPSVVLIAFGGREGEGRLLSLARRLRMKPESFALPVVILFSAESRSLRSAAQHLGADDYFAREVPAEELRARLASLLWRVESGRRSAPAVADQRSEIDNFLFLLDAVGDAARSGSMTGSLALVEAGGDREGEGSGDDYGTERRAHALTTAHGFLKLNLRRVDAVSFYGPATLLVHLAGADSASARATLSRMREEFSETSRGSDLFVGISSFPADGTEVERLVEQAEAALGEARGENSAAHVVVYGVRETRRAPEAERRTHAGSERKKTKAAVNEPGAPLAHEPTTASLKESAARSAAATQLGERRAGGRRLRRVMLVVSDAARMAQVNLLMRSAAYEVRAAFDGQHALNLLRIDRPDALVVDYALNEMDGVEMLRRLAKQSRAGQPPPAMLLLPAGREDLRGEALAAGVRGIIDMPYDAVELLDMLRELCDTE